MTDNEIIKAMQCVIGNGVSCSECEYQKALPFPSCRRMCAENALDLINRQKTEIEELRERISYLEKSIDCSRKEYNRLLQKLQQAKSEAIKEFAERLKSISIGLEIGNDKKFKMMAVSTIAIDKIAKEMTEVKENEKYCKRSLLKGGAK